MPPFAIARSGVAYVPETRDIFSSLTVQETCNCGPMGAANQRRWTIDAVLTLFPNLAARRHNGGGQLSGGEQQMLAIARALLMNPMLLILDEPTEGLAPIITKQIYRTLEALKADGMTMVLVEQNSALPPAGRDEISIISRGRCVWSGARRRRCARISNCSSAGCRCSAWEGCALALSPDGEKRRMH